MQPAIENTRLAVLLFTDIVGSTDLKDRHGPAAYVQQLRRHNTLFETGINETPGATIVKHTGDGYFVTFASSTDAVRFALLFQSRMGLEPWGDVPLATRLGIHVGEVLSVDQAGQQDVIGTTADLCARLMSLATGGQILLTRQAFDDARQFVRQGPAVGDKTPPLRWLAHGPYLFKGASEPIDVFEVGIEHFSPLAPPPDGEKVKRVLRHDEEPVLGWRPAPGLAVPQRPNFVLVEKLGEGGFGEVWLAENSRLRVKHVFKFCFNAQRVKALKREFTLFRLLKDALGQRPDIVTLLDYNLDDVPYFLESEYAPGGNLLDWSDARGGIATLTLDQRLDLLAKVADAVAAAHSVGILHKDIKPANILIHETAAGGVQPQLADFGIGFIADRTTIGQLNITEVGFTQMTELGEGGSSRTGTRVYAPPEMLMDRPYTQQGDVYALGVMYYQCVVADLRRPLAQGWERDIPAASDGDALLAAVLTEDIAGATDGDTTRRVATAVALATLLRTVRTRAAERAARIEERERVEAAERARVDAESRAVVADARRRRTRITAAIGLIFLAVLLGTAVIFLVRESRLRRDVQAQRDAVEQQRQAADAQRLRAEQKQKESDAILAFLNNQVFARATPVTMPDVAVRNAVFKAMLDPAIASIKTSLPDQPLVQAAVENTIAVVYQQLGRSADAEGLLRDALATRQKLLGDDHIDTIRTTNNYATVLNTLGRTAEAEKLYRSVLDRSRRLLGENDPDTINALNNYAFVLYTLGRSAEAEPLYREALDRRRKVLGEDHPSTILSLNNYASILQALGRGSEAEPLLKQVLEKRRRLLGGNHPDTLLSLANYANVLERLGRAAEAEPLDREVLDRRRQLLGPNHPDTLSALTGYAGVLDTLGRSAEAEPMYREAWAQWKSLRGDDHPETMKAQSNYAYILGALGRPAEAEPLDRDTVARCRRLLGNDHPQTVMSINNYAHILKSLDRAAEAEPLYREALETRTRVLGKTHPYTIASMNNDASVLEKLGRMPEAEAMYRQALTLAAANPSLGPHHPDTKDYAENLAHLLDVTGKATDAAAVRQQYEK